MRILTVKSISGDYATLVDADGEEIIVAMALLPAGVDEGVQLSYENMEFSVL